MFCDGRPAQQGPAGPPRRFGEVLRPLLTFRALTSCGCAVIHGLNVGKYIEQRWLWHHRICIEDIEVN